MTMQRIPDENVITSTAADVGVALVLAHGGSSGPLGLVLLFRDDFGSHHRVKLTAAQAREMHDGLGALRAMTTAELEATVQDLRDAEGHQ